MERIKVVGENCDALYNAVLALVIEAHFDAEIEKITDPQIIAKYKLKELPAVLVDDDIRIVGDTAIVMINGLRKFCNRWK